MSCKVADQPNSLPERRGRPRPQMEELTSYGVCVCVGGGVPGWESQAGGWRGGSCLESDKQMMLRSHVKVIDGHTDTNQELREETTRRTRVRE